MMATYNRCARWRIRYHLRRIQRLANELLEAA